MPKSGVWSRPRLSKLQRPSGDRVKTDARDARHLARLLHLGEIVAAAVPSADTEAARTWSGPVRTCAGDLMSARRLVSNLLLRQGIVYSGGQAWTGVHDRWLRAQKFTSPALTLTYETSYETSSPRWTVGTGSTRRSR